MMRQISQGESNNKSENRHIKSLPRKSWYIQQRIYNNEIGVNWDDLESTFNILDDS